MKVVFSSPGTEEYFKVVLAVAQKVSSRAAAESIANLRMYFLSNKEVSARDLFDNGLTYVESKDVVLRRGVGFNPIVFVRLLFKLFKIYPDVLFVAGDSQTMLVRVARLLGVSVVYLEVGSRPGRASSFIARRASRVGVVYREAMDILSGENVVFVGFPLLKELEKPVSEGAAEYLKLEADLPVVFFLCGGDGGNVISENVESAVESLVKKYQVIHEVGKDMYGEYKETMESVLSKIENGERYRLYARLNTLALRMAAGVATVVVTPSGPAMFSVAAWGIPAIIIPNMKQKKGDPVDESYRYASSGAGVVIEAKNVSPHILVSEVDRIVGDPSLYGKMKESAKKFAELSAAKKLADEVVDLAIVHED